MILEFLKCMASLAVILLSGSLIYHWIIRKEDRRWLEAVAYGWGAGLVLLYVAGGLLIRVRALSPLWHYYYLGFIAVFMVILTALRGLGRAPSRQSDAPLPGKRTKVDAWCVAMLLFVCLHAGALLWINLNHPVFDSDAVEYGRWVGLAKELYKTGGVGTSTFVQNPMFPSLIPLWSNLFTLRWHDSFAALPWFLFYIAFLAVSWQFVYRITGEVKYGLIYCCLLVSVPILWVHVIRPGFSDLIVCYFTAAVFSMLFNSYYYRSSQYFLLSLVFMAGACMTKQEGVAWMVVIYLVYAVLYLYEKRGLALRHFLITESAVIGLGFAAYLLSYRYLHELVVGRSRYLALLFRVQFDMNALAILAERTFTWGTFGVYWYLLLGLLAYVAIRSRNPFYRLVCFQIVLVFGLLIYFFCATGNVKLTLAGTNTSRLLLHWIPSGSLLLIMLLTEQAPLTEKS